MYQLILDSLHHVHHCHTFPLRHFVTGTGWPRGWFPSRILPGGRGVVIS